MITLPSSSETSSIKITETQQIAYDLGVSIMKFKYAIISLISIIFSASISAGMYEGHYYDEARVVHVEPIREVFTRQIPEEECWEVPAGYYSRSHYHRSSDSPYHAAGVVTGGIIGGIIGNQFGSGSGNVATTVAGGLLGAALGHGMASDDTTYYREDHRVRYKPYKSRRCQTIYRDVTEERTVSYDVTYEYNGRNFVTNLLHHPGDSIRVRVDLVPSV